MIEVNKEICINMYVVIIVYNDLPQPNRCRLLNNVRFFFKCFIEVSNSQEETNGTAASSEL